MVDKKIQARNRANKRRGAEAERNVAEYLSQWWPMAEPRRLTGIHDRGDITGIPDTVVEVKNEKKFDLGGWVKELVKEKRNDRAKFGTVIAKRRGTRHVGEWYAILPVDEWVKLRLLIDGADAGPSDQSEDSLDDSDDES